MFIKNANRRIFVFTDWCGMLEPLLMGILSSELLRGKEIFSFEYNSDWLKSGYARIIDPDLQLFSGSQYIHSEEKINFGLFLDSSPDRWGRLLMRRREAALARKENRPPNILRETDYLLGVYDQHRMGALRFKKERNGPFLNDDKDMAAPPWASIRNLEQISLKLEDDNAINDPEYFNWLQMLVFPGSSLGGARPKASVIDPDNHLWIAKFPSKNDITDVGGWEFVTYLMAKEAGINMAPCIAQKFNTKNHTFLAKRFDRTKKGERIHFASAMTMLGYTDGDSYRDGVSYLELVDFIMSKGAKVNEDLRELWRRIIFSICVSNTDDHLRNHGFILTNHGWLLSPAYDINPNEMGSGLSLNISENDNSLSLELAMDVHEYFRLTKIAAIEIVEQVKSVTGKWRNYANQLSLSKVEQDIIANAFRG
jgi:serine/threonine-protein kinase HipA